MKEISLSEAMKFMVDEDKVINAKAEGVYAPNNFSAGFVAKHGLGVRVWEIRFKDGTFQFRCPGDDEWLSPFHFEDEYKYYLQEEKKEKKKYGLWKFHFSGNYKYSLQEEKKEKKKYWLWVDPRSGYVSTLYRDEKGRTPELSDTTYDFSGWIKLPWSEIEL